jgi:predicted amidohydrolase YtcJ
VSRSTRTLLIGAAVYSRSEPFATALLIDDGIITWVGDDAGAKVHRDIADNVVDLNGAFLAPGFVDSHVHAASTGLRLLGLDLSHTRSARDVLEAVSAKAKDVRGALIYGHGWDQSTWSDPTLPTRSELDRASWGSEVYLSRIDVHSALVSSALIARAPAARSLEGFSDSGFVIREAHHVLREETLTRISVHDRTAAHAETLAAAARAGIVALHEMGGPTIGGADDLRDLLRLSQEQPGPIVFGYWGELARDGGIDTAREVGAIGVGGDLFVDGSLGSHTACLSEAYADLPNVHGTQYLSGDEITQHIVEVTRAGMQGGFHVIGDAACSSVTAGFQRAGEIVGVDTLRARNHRLEHAEMLSEADISTLVTVGAAFSMQPLFDGYWGGLDGMYSTRLGRERAQTMNRFATIIAQGGHLTLNSDSPVTPMDPWAILRAATEHSVPAEQLTARAAFTAMTRGAWRAVGDHRAGAIAVGSPAHLAAWSVEDLEVRVPDERVQGWSTDPRSATPGLPILDGPDPVCLATWVDGDPIFGREFLEVQRG